VKKAIPAIAMLTLLLGMTQAYGEVTYNDKYPYDMAVWVECANGGAGELVTLSGELHELWVVTLDGNGGYHLKMHFNASGIKGTGDVTGAKYQAVGVTQDQMNGKIGVEYTYVNNFRIIGQGKGNNFTVHENIHITILADGTVTAYHDDFKTECK
jgi:hypothetical protein